MKMYSLNSKSDNNIFRLVFSDFQSELRSPVYKLKDFRFQVVVKVKTEFYSARQYNIFIRVFKKTSPVFGSFKFNISDLASTTFRLDNYDSKECLVFTCCQRIIELMKSTGSMFIEVLWAEDNYQVSVADNKDQNSTTKKKYQESVAENEMISSSLCWLLEKEEFSDVTIVTEDGTISAHKCILSARSQVFFAMLKSDMSEARNNCIEILDLSTSTVTNMIKFLYTGCLSELTYDSAAELLKAADKYEIAGLKVLCVSHLMQHLQVSNALDLLSLMDTYHIDDSKKSVLKFIADNRVEFSKVGTFDCLNDLSLLKEILYVVLKK